MSIFQQTLRDLGELGVESTACKAILKQIHLHSIEVAAKIIVQRRIMDSQNFGLNFGLKNFGSTKRPP